MKSILLTLVLLKFSTATSFATQYIVTDLGSASSKVSVNNSGQATGTSNDLAWIWSAGTRTSIGTLGGSTSFSQGIDDLGRVFGYSYTGDHLSAFSYAQGQITNLGRIPNRNSSYALGANDLGYTVGYASSGEGTSQNEAVYWNDGAITSIGYYIANDINNNNVVVGNDGHMAFAFSLVDGPIQLASLTGSYSSQAMGVNDEGIVVGSVFFDNSIGERAVFWQGDAVHELGTLQGDSFSSATSINSSGNIIGLSIGEFQRRPFVYTQESGMMDLNTLISASSNWELSEATGINDSGMIVGYGLFNGQHRAFLLTPVPEPSALNFVLSGCVAILLFLTIKAKAQRGGAPNGYPWHAEMLGRYAPGIRHATGSRR